MAQYIGFVDSVGTYARVVDNSWTSVFTYSYTGDATPSDITFSPNQQYMVITHYTAQWMKVYNTSDWSEVSYTPVTGAELDGYTASFSPDGAYLAVGTSGLNRLYIWDTSTWNYLPDTPVISSYVNEVSFSPDGAYLAVAHDGGTKLTIISTSTWTAIGGTPSLAGTGKAARYSPNGAYLATGMTMTPYFRVYNTNSWNAVTGTPTFTAACNGVSFSPDGQYLAIAHSTSPYLTILSTSDWSVVSDTPVLGGAAYGVEFYPDGTHLVVANSNSTRLTVIATGDWSVVSGTYYVNGDTYAVAVSIVASPSGDSFYTHTHKLLVTAIDWNSATLRMAWVSDDYTFSAPHTALTDLGATVVATSESITPSATNSVLGLGYVDFTLPNTTGSHAILYAVGDYEGVTDPLLVYLSNISTTMHGTNLRITAPSFISIT